MPYKPVFIGDFEYDFKWLSHKIIHEDNNTIFIGTSKRKDTARIIVKGSGVIKIPENIKIVMIEKFLDTNTLEIPKSVRALQISSKTVKKYNISIPDTVKELDIVSEAQLEHRFDVSKLKNLRAFYFSYAPNVKSIGKLPENLEYLTLSNLGLKTFPKKLPLSLKEMYIKHFKNVIDFPDLSYLKNLEFVGIEYTAISKFSKIPPSPKAYLQFIEIPQGSAKFPDSYKERPSSLRVFTCDPYYHVINGKVQFQKRNTESLKNKKL